jgi:cytochrome c-type biogenesis protein CcmH
VRGKAWMLTVVMGFAWAADWSPSQHRQYQMMTRQFHCLVCYHESLVDSRSPFADSLRGEIRRIIDAGGSDDRIIDYVSSRYGYAINQLPDWQGEGVLLWLGPPVLWLATVRRLSRKQGS